MGTRTWIAVGLVVALLAGAGCSPPNPGGRTAVASFYPLAFAGRRVAGPGWRVMDLTPPGAEAHDVELSAEQRAAMEGADVVLYLGDVGFQPQVERAVTEASGTVVGAVDQDELSPGHGPDEAVDPHVWLDPVRFTEIVDRIAEGFAQADPQSADAYRRRAAVFAEDLEGLDARYRDALDGCDSSVMVVSHEAFGYLADRYGLEQVGLAGLVPEAEPTVDRLGAAGERLASGDARAVFYEEGEEARRTAAAVAADFGVPALPLATLEARPSRRGYLSAMERNLASLTEGLGCP